MTTTAAEPLGHLTPFVIRIVRKRVAAGETFTPEMLGECLRQAADAHTAQCIKWGGFADYENGHTREVRQAGMTYLSRAIYDSIREAHKDDPPPGITNPRWLRCAAALGIAPEKLRNLDYITWREPAAV